MQSAGDFHRFDLPSAFYTTKQKRSAELWSESLITSVPTNKREGKVIKFKLNLHDLKVYDFGTEKEGAKYELWKKVKSAYIYYLGSETDTVLISFSLIIMMKKQVKLNPWQS